MKKLVSLLILGATVSSYAVDSIDYVACVGRIIPQERVQKLAVSAPTGAQAVIETLNVKQGDIIKEDEIVAVIAGEKTALATLKRAKAALEIAKSARDIKVMEQNNIIADMQGELQQITNILTEKDPPRREREELEYNQTSLMRKIAHAKAILPLIEKNQNDIVAESSLAVEEADKVHKSYFVKSPISGKVLEMHIKEGEAVSMEGVCEIANISKLFVEAEIYVADVAKVKVGAKATITSDALKGKTFDGTVVSISSSVKNNKVFSSDPSEFSNLKVVRAKIKLDDCEALKNLIGSQVNDRISVK
ncbi:MAG: efflux RND transporter periplasmic adaptor subunit [Opitutales bacterium]|nr:efflux RND transporter periplasmic adaptor subunit [Opitutales bacterium]